MAQRAVRRRTAALGVAALLALLAGPLLASPAGWRVAAHAQLVTSSPAAGSILEEPPAELRLVFSEPLESTGTSLDLIAEDGSAALTRAGIVDPDDRYALVVAGPGLTEGVFQIRWRTLSSADGHPAEGTFTFGVGVSALPEAQPGAETHAETSALEIAGRALSYPGLLLAVGLPIFAAVVLRRGPMPRAGTGALAVALTLSAAATLATALLTAAGTGDLLGGLLGGRNAMLQVARAAVAGLGAAALPLVAPRLAGPLAATVGVIGLTLLVAAGHASALPGPVPILAQLVHVLGVAVWVSGIAALLVLLVRPRLLTEAEPRPPMRELVPRFSALALASIGLVAASGVYAAWTQTGTLLPAGTEYGGPLLIKVAVAAVAIALGGLNFLDGGRMREWLNGMPTRLSLEATLVGIVLVASAALAFTQPTDEPRGVAIDPVPDAFGEVLPGLGMEVVPGRPGLNRAVVTATDALAWASIDLALVLDRLDGGSSTRVPLAVGGGDHSAHSGHTAEAVVPASQRTGPPEWVADALVLPADSTWDASVVILRPGGEELARQRFAFTLDEDGVDEGRSTSLVDPATLIAAGLAVGGVLGVGLGLGGMPLPRCDAAASRVALIGGGAVGAMLGVAIGLNRLVG